MRLALSGILEYSVIRRERMLATCAAIHDLSCYAKSSLTIVSPIMESMGIEVCPVPSALLSTQTDGFDGYLFKELTEEMRSVLEHWDRLGLVFNAIYSGFLGSPQQISTVVDFIAAQRTICKPLVLVDPVLGDNGKTYGPMDDSLISGMRSLVSQADVITPNTTEAALLLGVDWQERISESDIFSYVKDLSELGPQKVILTGVLLERSQSRCSVAWYDRAVDDFGLFSHRHVDASYPGAGDLFASLLCGLLLWGRPFPSAVEQSALWVATAIERTHSLGYPYRHGICPSLLIPTIVKHRLDEEGRFK